MVHNKITKEHKYNVLGKPEGSCSGIVFSIIKFGNKTPTLYPFQIVKRIHPLKRTGINSQATLKEVISNTPAKNPFKNSTITIILYSQKREINKLQKKVKISANFRTNILPKRLVKNPIEKLVMNFERQKPIPIKEI